MTELTRESRTAGRPLARASHVADRRRSLTSSVLGSRYGAMAVVFACSALLAAAIADDRLRPLLLIPLPIVGLWAVGHFRFAAVCAVVALSATVVAPHVLKVPVGPLDIRLTELLLGALLAVACLRPRRNWWGGATGAALAIFFATVALSSILALQADRTHPVDAYEYTRALAPLLLFFVIVRLTPNPGEARRLLLIATVMAAMAGFASVLAAPPGSPLSGMLNPTGGDAIRDTEGLGLVNRVRLPGVALAYGLFWYAALRAMRSERTNRLPWLLVMGGLVAGLALSFNRNMWLGLVLGLLMVLALTQSPVRRRLAGVLLGLVGTMAAFGLSGGEVDRKSPVFPLVERATSLLRPEEQARQSSLTDRFVENRFAVAAIREHPVLGVGPGAPFGLRYILNEGNGVFSRQNALFVHNQYFHVLLIAGPLALLSLLAFLVGPVVAGVRRARRDDDFVALAASIVMIMASALVMISFVSATDATVLALLVGTLTVLLSAPPERHD